MVKRVKLEAIGAAVWLLLQMTSAYSVIGHIPSHSQFRIRDRRSAANPVSPLSCDKVVVNDLVKSATETCSQINIVDQYIENVKSHQAIPVPSITDRHGFKDILNQYNNGLKKAQDNCHPWRNGDSIVGSLKNMVLAAQEFEPKFNEELVKNQARVKNLLENHADIKQVEAKISALEKDIREAKEAANLTSVSSVLTHLETVIKSKEEEINSTMKEHELIQGRRELAELVKYLEFVKTISANVEGKAENARTKISNFRDNIEQDSGVFERHHTVAQQGIQNLEEETKNNNNALTSNKKSISDLRAKINQENTQITSLNGQIQSAKNELKAVEARINRNLRTTRRKRKFGRWFRFVPVAGWIIGNRYYKDAKKREEALANQKRQFISGTATQVKNLQAHIARRNQDIATHQSRIGTIEAKSLQLQEELQHFTQLNEKLQGVQNDASNILPFISNAINGVSKMRNTFDTIKASLVDTIQTAKEAKSEAEVINMKYFIYNEIDELKCKWNNARDKILLAEQCS